MVRKNILGIQGHPEFDLQYAIYDRIWYIYIYIHINIVYVYLYIYIMYIYIYNTYNNIYF